MRVKYIFWVLLLLLVLDIAVVIGCQMAVLRDGEGYRTIASIKRAKEVFGADTLTIISQQFHNERALFMAQHNGMDAIAYNAANTSSRKWKIIMAGRECLSRVKAVFEVMGDKTRNE